MSITTELSPPSSLDELVRRRAVLVGGAAAVVTAIFALVAVLSLGTGALAIPPERVVAILTDFAVGRIDATDRDTLVLLSIRLPRLLAGALIGATLAVGGALMQGLFRNPLADPGLVGVSSGALLAAALTIVVGDALLARHAVAAGFVALPPAAFVGGLATTLLLYTVATRRGQTSIATMLLAGIAVQAVAGAGIGVLQYLSDDRQLRDLTFWTMGSLGGATWSKLAIVAPVLLACLAVVPFLARGLNALLLGEAEALFMGLSVQRIKFATIAVVALGIGTAVSVGGLIGFVGIVVPHVLRLFVGSDHRALLPLSAAGGAVLLVGADTLARTVVAPAELPIGIVTAVIGAPFFLWLVASGKRSLT